MRESDGSGSDFPYYREIKTDGYFHWGSPFIFTFLFKNADGRTIDVIDHDIIHVMTSQRQTAVQCDYSER